MPKQYAGLRLVEYSTNGSSWTAVAGKITRDSTFEPGIIVESETTDSTLHGGYNTTGDVGFYDFAAFSTLNAGMVADTEYFLRLTMNDGTRFTASPAFEIKVQEMNRPSAADGLSMFRLRWNKFWPANLWTKSS
jgi:hypothetical protein